MLAGEVDLGSIKLAEKRSRLSLNLTSSCTILFPNTTRKELPTAAELSEASYSGQIWISKAGSCQLDFLTLVNGEPLDDSAADPTLVSMVAHLSAECQVWQEIGLDLRLKHVAESDNPQHSETAYFLRHPDLSSGLIAPLDLPTAQFQGLRCEINFRFEITEEEPQGLLEHTDIHVPSLEEPTHQETPRHSHGLRRNPKRTGKAQEAMEDGLSKPKTSKTPAVKRTLGHVEDLEEEDIAKMAYMLDTALRKLIGVKKASPGSRLIKSPPMPALIEIAPAVWNLQYLQLMAVHSSTIPMISAGISRLMNARSASLRDKVQRLADRAAAQNGTCVEKNDSEETPSDGIKKRLWLLCQTTIWADPTKRLPTQRRANGKEANPDPSEWAMMEEYNDPLNYADEGTPNAGNFESCEYETKSDSYNERGEEMLDLPETNHLILQEVTAFDELGPGPYSEGLTGSSEGEYFYMDTDGNLIPVEHGDIVVGHELGEHGREDWESSPQLEEFHAHEAGHNTVDHGYDNHEEGYHHYENNYRAHGNELDAGDEMYIVYDNDDDDDDDLPHPDMFDEHGLGHEYDEDQENHYRDVGLEYATDEHEQSGYGEVEEERPLAEDADERYIMYHEEQYSGRDWT